MNRLLWFIKSVFNKNIPTDIKLSILKGYHNIDFSPRKCPYCKNKKFHRDCTTYGDYYIEEYELLCDRCNERVGLWSYGSWYE